MVLLSVACKCATVFFGLTRFRNFRNIAILLPGVTLLSKKLTFNPKGHTHAERSNT